MIFKDMNDVDTFYDKYIDIDTEIINSDEYKSKIPSHRKNNPEHCQTGYNLINNSKICFIKHTKKYFSNYKFYSWIDFIYFSNTMFCWRTIKHYPAIILILFL